MKQHLTLLLLAGILLSATACTQVAPPAPIGPLPSESQLAWHELEYYGFVHFNMNTFTNMEWGLGGESPAQFNPDQLDTRQWARIAKEAGMKGIILTAKHHDGFSLWPSAYTEHSIKNSPWKEGKGDVIRDLAEACEEFGLKMGLYLSPWDRNHAAYGEPEYVDYFHNQLRELLTNYGDVFEVWFDGANGGSGYYGGANEARKIDSKTYYQWDKVTQIVRDLQPDAVIFSDAGPDVRWVGNEQGWANETNWSILRRDEVYPAWPKYVELRSGHEDGTHWVPAEADVSIRPGWYYHPSEDHQVKSLPHLLDIYYQSVGRNASLLLNLPVDDRGLVHENDIQQLMALKKQLDKDFTADLAKSQRISASNVRGNSSDFAAKNVIDGRGDTYWATDDEVVAASLTIAFQEPTEVNRIVLQEYIALGQRVQEFSVEAEIDGEWKEIDRQTTIGYKRILRFDTVVSTGFRVNILKAKGPPTLSNIELYHAPNVLTPPVPKRNKEGLVSFEVPDKNIEVYYTLDGSTPTRDASRYTEAFLVDSPATLKAISFDPEAGQQTETVTQYFDLSKKDWKVTSVSSGDISEADKMIDDNPDTYWATAEEVNTPQEVVIDLGRQRELNGFTYWPIQERWSFGIITDYEFAVSTDGRRWRAVANGEFSNVLNNPIEQTVRFEAAPARFIKIKAAKVGAGLSGTAGDYRASFGEIGVLTSTAR